MTASVADAVERFGGIDIVVAAAGMFGPSLTVSDWGGQPLDQERKAPGGGVASDEADRQCGMLSRADRAEAWQQVLDVNVAGVANTLPAALRLMRHSPTGGRVVVVGSKNVPAPGTGAADYSASKAALTQLARVASLE